VVLNRRARWTITGRLPEDDRTSQDRRFNLGDTIVDEQGDVYADGVAARLESVAYPGGILIYGNVHGKVEGKLDVGCCASSLTFSLPPLAPSDEAIGPVRDHLAVLSR